MSLPQTTKRRDSVEERLTRYVQIDTQSRDDESVTSIKPTSPGQLDMLRLLMSECQEMGLADVELHEAGYLTATLPGHTGRDADVPTIGLIAHVDTALEYSGANVKPQVIRDYDGGDIVLGESGLVLSPEAYPALRGYQGQTIMTTDGTTLLGADDKAGVAAILTACQMMIDDPSIVHGDVRLAFTTDEEVGRGVEGFDVEAFGADWAYTIDGSEIGELSYECFCAAKATITVQGVAIHPGFAFEKLRNASSIAGEFDAMIPANERPETTKDEHGFYFLYSIQGDSTQTTMTYFLRDFTTDGLADRTAYLQEVADQLNTAYDADVIDVQCVDQYTNMRYAIENNITIIDTAVAAMETCGIHPRIQAIRGGTDGARLTEQGLLCPNLFAGGHNFHSLYEFVPLESVVASASVMCEILRRGAAA